MKILIAVFFLIVSMVFHAEAQYHVTNTPQKPTRILQNELNREMPMDTVQGRWDHLTINSDSRINELLMIRKEECLRKKGIDGVVGIDGYRVHIYQGTKYEADRVYSKFLSKYPEYEVHKFFPSPDFIVRVGDFRERSEAIHLQHLIEKDFPNSLIVEDVIHFPELEEENGMKGEL